jgi:ATP-binding cassette, subfamily B, bacterial CvaB/MchF/RaxB
MAGLIKPSGGQLLVDGNPVTPGSLAGYRARIGCVLQDDHLFAGSIADNIAAFDPAYDVAWVAEGARMAAIHDEILAMPMQTETLVGDMGSPLSGGHRQRIILARALYRRPSILYLDEATSHLDSDNEARINGAIKQLSMTRIMIAHRNSILAMADRVLKLGGGAGGGHTVNSQ